MLQLKDNDYEKMPGHWVLAKMGKTVLRPGGIEITKKMIRNLHITENDKVVEFAPGLGVTARLTLENNPLFYTGIEQDPEAARRVSVYLNGENQQCIVSNAEETGLETQSATVVYCEAMLTMQPTKMKNKIIHEAHRILEAGGKYGIHEMCLLPDDISEAMKNEIHKELSTVIRVNARPLTISEWKDILEQNGFTIEKTETAPMHLLNVTRIIDDEGLKGTMRLGVNIMTTPKARTRILEMKKVFDKYSEYLGAVSIVAQKKA
ncbi:MAG: methyltransferase domain-containing protein [Anaerobacillus sp.]|uniref:methyltransferase domain-containing protein n=1 Tax=Anaerobacillus sp. TaxID=1872506 RepID=UPI00391C2725